VALPAETDIIRDLHDDGKMGNIEHPTIAGKRTVIRPARLDDLELLTAWFAVPDVYFWWGGEPIDRDEVLTDYTGHRSPDVESFIIESDRKPVGYMQYWRATARSGGLDMFLVPQARGRGLGPDSARAMVHYLLDELGWTDVTADPLRENDHAIRAWARAGFAADHEDVDEQTGKPCLIMVARR
jgi:aminoglycoside 6'-N-acetyltransferase